MISRILVVCTGNICRSPYAEARLRTLMPEALISSAGIATKISRLQNKPADSVATRVALEYFDLDISEHKAKQVTEEMVEAHEAIFTMDNTQLEELREQYPAATDKTFLLGHWIEDSVIDDPYRQGVPTFRATFTKIDKAINEWVSRLG